MTVAATDNALFLIDLKARLDGGNNLLNGFRECVLLMLDSHLTIDRRTAQGDLTTFAASASETFQIDGVQYVAVASQQAYMTELDCLAMYTDAIASATECQYLLSLGFTSSAVANASQCSPTCDNPTSIVSHKTETVIYTVGPTTTATDASGRTVNLAPPGLVEVQRIPSLGVSDLHFLRLVEPATQSSYEACFGGNTSFCYDSSTAATLDLLVVVVKVVA